LATFGFIPSTIAIGATKIAARGAPRSGRKSDLGLSVPDGSAILHKVNEK
jgi:hypothetical protein